MQMKKIFLIFFLLITSYKAFVAEMTDEQKALLDTLPPDQRESIMIKMGTAQDLTDELEETFKLCKDYNLRFDLHQYLDLKYHQVQVVNF